MKFKVTHKKLNDCLKNVTPFIDRSQHLDSVRNLLLKTSGNSLEVSATNIEAEIIEKLHGSALKQGEITVPASLFKDYISSFYLAEEDKSNHNIEMELDKNKLSIVYKKSKGSIVGLKPEYVRLPFKRDKKPLVQIKAEELQKALSQTVFAASKDVSRPVLSGLLFCFLGGHFCLVGCDSYRLAEKKVINVLKKASNKEQPNFKVIVPARNLLKLSRVLVSYPEKTVSIYQDEEKQRLAFIFDDDEIEVTINLTEGAYPEYSSLLPDSFKTEIIVGRRQLVAIASRINLFMRDPSPSIVFSWSDKAELTVRSIGSQAGETQEQLPAKIKHLEKDPIETITLNVKHLLEALQAIDGDEVKIKIQEKLKPCILLDCKNEIEYQHVLMPMFGNDKN